MNQPPNNDPRGTATASPRSIIAVTRDHIGDLVCTTPALRSLRHLYPDAHLAVYVGVRAASVLENNPHVDEIILRPYRHSLWDKMRFVRLLRRRRFDLGVVLTDSPDAILHLWLGGVRHRAAFVRREQFSRLLTARTAYEPHRHEMIDNFRNVVALLGGDVSDPQPELFPDAEDRAAVDRLFARERIGPGETLIALNPGASLPTRRWPAESFAALGDLLSARPGVRVLLLGGPDDRSLADDIRRRMARPPTVCTGRVTVVQLAELLRRCHVVVTGDTGPMHVACAVRTPVVAIFGVTVPHACGPGYVPGNCVLRKVSGCPRCTREVCRDEQHCMRLITPAEVAAVVARQLQLRARRGAA
jgi:lipopolysaccharide heptosyltransferase II